jgi:hypothetical protein
MLTAAVVAMIAVPVIFLALARPGIVQPQRAYRRVRVRPDA